MLQSVLHKTLKDSKQCRQWVSVWNIKRDRAVNFWEATSIHASFKLSFNGGLTRQQRGDCRASALWQRRHPRSYVETQKLTAGSRLRTSGCWEEQLWNTTCRVRQQRFTSFIYDHWTHTTSLESFHCTSASQSISWAPLSQFAHHENPTAARTPPVRTLTWISQPSRCSLRLCGSC